MKDFEYAPVDNGPSGKMMILIGIILTLVIAGIMYAAIVNSQSPTFDKESTSYSDSLGVYAP